MSRETRKEQLICVRLPPTFSLGAAQFPKQTERYRAGHGQTTDGRWFAVEPAPLLEMASRQ
jgi:hypothetical protein